jgi:hypothetical protein
MIAILILIIVNAYLWINYSKDPILVETMEKYKMLREHLIETNDPKFRMLHREIPIVAYKGSFLSGIGYNTNKGQEIGLCVDGTSNHVFHVLLHELAHCTVDEYSHSTGYWKNYTDLKNEAIKIGIYEDIESETPFCGKTISD